jgi:hypothetical protein
MKELVKKTMGFWVVLSLIFYSFENGAYKHQTQFSDFLRTAVMRS